MAGFRDIVNLTNIHCLVLIQGGSTLCGNLPEEQVERMSLQEDLGGPCNMAIRHKRMWSDADHERRLALYDRNPWDAVTIYKALRERVVWEEDLEHGPLGSGRDGATESLHHMQVYLTILAQMCGNIVAAKTRRGRGNFCLSGDPYVPVGMMRDNATTVLYDKRLPEGEMIVCWAGQMEKLGEFDRPLMVGEDGRPRVMSAVSGVRW